jgi:hypothetical protein
MLTNRNELFYQASRIMELADHRSFTGVADVLSAFAAMYGAQVCAAESASCSASCFESHK